MILYTSYGKQSEILKEKLNELNLHYIEDDTTKLIYSSHNERDVILLSLLDNGYDVIHLTFDEAMKEINELIDGGVSK